MAVSERCHFDQVSDVMNKSGMCGGSEPAFLSSSFVESDLTSLSPEGLQFEAKNKSASAVPTWIEHLDEACREKYLLLFDIFRSACIFPWGPL